jgi:uncharacterized protein YuzE
MIITHDALVDLLTEHSVSDSDTSPREALYIKFAEGDGQAKETITYHTVSGGLLVIDTDESGRVRGIEVL